MLDAGVGMTVEKDSFKAGKELAKSALENMSAKPKLAILGVDSLTRKPFDYNQLLAGVKEEIGPEVELIGSSVNGVLVNDRFAMRSAGLMLLGGDINVEKTFNYGKSRVDYKNIAENVYQSIKDLEPNKDRFMLIFQDGIKLPQEVLDKQKSLNSRFVSLFTGLVKRVFMRQIEEFKESGMGMPSIQEFLEELYAKGWSSQVIGNVATNVRNYDSIEFYNDIVGKDNIIGAIIAPQGSTKFGFGFGAGAEPTGKSCNIEKNIGSFLLKIDDKPALLGLCDAAGIKKEALKELRGGAYLNYYTILGTTEKTKGGDVIHLAMTMTNPDLENLINSGFPFEKVPNRVEIFQSNTNILHKTAENAVKQAVQNLNNPKFLLGFDCAIRFFAYGDNLPKIVKTVNNAIGKDIPKMVLGSGGEIFGTKDIDYYFNNMTFVTLAGGD